MALIAPARDQFVVPGPQPVPAWPSAERRVFILVSGGLHASGPAWSPRISFGRSRQILTSMGVAHEVVLRTRSSGPLAPTPLHVVKLARPEGDGRALTTCRIPIEGREEWEAAARIRSA